MKKLLFAFVALAAMSFASCGNGQKGAAQDSDTIVAQDSDTLTAGDSLTDSTTVATTDSTVAQ